MADPPGSPNPSTALPAPPTPAPIPSSVVRPSFLSSLFHWFKKPAAKKQTQTTHQSAPRHARLASSVPSSSVHSSSHSPLLKAAASPRPQRPSPSSRLIRFAAAAAKRRHSDIDHLNEKDRLFLFASLEEAEGRLQPLSLPVPSSPVLSFASSSHSKTLRPANKLEEREVSLYEFPYIRRMVRADPVCLSPPPSDSVIFLSSTEGPPAPRAKSKRVSITNAIQQSLDHLATTTTAGTNAHYQENFTVSELLAFLLLGSTSSDIQLRREFFISLPYFTQPAEVMAGLYDALLMPYSVHLIGAKSRDHAIHAWRQCKAHIVYVLSCWINEFPEDFKENQQATKTFAKNVATQFPPPHWPEEHAKHMKQLVEPLLKQIDACLNGKPVGDFLLQSPRSRSQTDAQTSESALTLDFSLYPLPVFVSHLCLLAHSRYHAVSARHLPRSTRLRLPESMNQMKQSNRMSCWAASDVLRRTDDGDRQDAFANWIMMASGCLKLRNYNTAFEIMYGLSHYSVYRLKSLVAALSPETLAAYHQLLDIIDSKGNYAKYRSLFAEPAAAHDKARVPFFGVLLKDIASLEESRPGPLMEDGVTANFLKCRRLAGLITDALKYQQFGYQHTQIPALMDLLTAAINAAMAEPELAKASNRILPMKNRAPLQ